MVELGQGTISGGTSAEELRMKLERALVRMGPYVVHGDLPLHKLTAYNLRQKNNSLAAPLETMVYIWVGKPIFSGAYRKLVFSEGLISRNLAATNFLGRY